ncbi:hypothetical protein HDU76_004344 [Blyttiomyces sp. JEL0837]|nr:hypothetical protein HDU76_004344 [Blyttiomyces sp. JEL0837]
MSPSGQLPFMLTPQGRVLCGREILDEVKDYTKASNAETRDGPADSVAFAALIETKLHFALVRMTFGAARVFMAISH